MAQRKTRETGASVDDFVDSISDEVKRRDCRALVDLFSSATGQEPKMWGEHIVGFGKRHYHYANGKPAELCKIGFAPRARSFALYIARFPGREALLDNLGKHKFCGGCLHIPKVDAVDLEVLETIVRKGYLHEGTGSC